MMDERPLGIVLFLVGAVGTAVAALADPLGIGEGEVFGWLQITGVVIGGIVALLGLGMAMEWVPYPGRARDTTAASGGQNTTIVEDRPPRDPTT
jgi:hypothetical protein